MFCQIHSVLLLKNKLFSLMCVKEWNFCHVTDGFKKIRNNIGFACLDEMERNYAKYKQPLYITQTNWYNIQLEKNIMDQSM